MSERGIHALLLALLLGQLLLLSSRPEARGSFFEASLLKAAAPLGRAVGNTLESAGDLTSSLRGRRALLEENRALREQMAAASRELVRLHGVEEELGRLSRLSGYSRRTTEGFFVADVVLVDRASWLRTLVLYTGPSKPETNQPVVTPQGLVGRVVVPSGHYAKVQLITDRSLSVSAMIRRTRRQGLVRGATERSLELTMIPKQADVVVGDQVVTAGIDGVFPRGIPIGEVIAVESGQGLFHHIELEPAIDLGLLDQVYVLTLEKIPAELREAWERGAS